MLYIIWNIISWCFLKKDTTWHDYIELLEFGMPFQQVNLKQLPRVVFLKTQDAHRARASELESTGTARSIRCRNWHQVETDWKRRISELKLFDCQNLSKLFPAADSSCVDQVHVCPVCAELPPEMPTLGLAATYLVDIFPPLARSASTWKLWMKMYDNGIDNVWTFVPRWNVGVFFHGLNYAEEWPELRIQISTTFAQTWHTGRPVPCLDDCSLSKVHDVWHWSTIFLAFLCLAFF